MRSTTVRFFHEHVLVKEPGTAEVTPWHHDQPYYCVDGDQNVSFWISLDSVPADAGVEFLVGSHRWGRNFVPRKFVDSTAYAAAEHGFELVPDIDARAATAPHRTLRRRAGRRDRLLVPHPARRSRHRRTARRPRVVPSACATSETTPCSRCGRGCTRRRSSNATSSSASRSTTLGSRWSTCRADGRSGDEGSAGLRRPLGQGHVEADLLAVALDDHGHFVAGLIVADRADDAAAAVDLLAVDLDDDVAGLDAGDSAGESGLISVTTAPVPPSVARPSRTPRKPLACASSPSALARSEFELGQHLVDRDREPDVVGRVGRVATGDGGVDARPPDRQR